MPEARYTHGHHDSVLRSHRWRTAANSAAYLVPLLRPGMDVLDVGCGPGTITVELAQLTAPGRTVGIDPAAEVIDGARALGPDPAIGQAGEEASVDFRVGDVMSLPFDDGSFDVVHAHQVLQHLVDPVGALRQMARVCRPGGVLAVRDSDYDAMTWYPHDPDLDAWLAMYRKVASANGGEPDAGRYLLHWAHEAGLGDVRSSASAWCFASDNDRAWWGGLWADRVLQSALATRATELGYATHDDLVRMSKAWRRWAAADDGWFAVLHGEILATKPG